MDRSTLLSCGAAGGLVVLALFDSLVVASLLAALLASSWWWGAGGDKGDEKVNKGKTSAHSSLLGEIQAFPEAASLTPVKSLEPQSGASLLVQEMVVHDIASFDRGELRQTEVEERNVLPDQSDIKAEREKVELIGGIENFDLDNLARVSMKEPLSGAELVRQELGHQAVQLEIGAFDQTGLKVTEVKDSSWLPDQKDITEEKEKVDHLSNIETFDTEGLHRVKTLEPLSGAELLKREITLKAVTEELGSFDVGSMRTTEVEEKNVLPDTAVLAEEKSRESLLAGIGTFAQSVLAPVKVAEPLSGPELARQESLREGISTELASFDKAELRETEVEEKGVLPGSEDIQAERRHMEHIQGLESGLQLRSTQTREPSSPLDLAKLELNKDQMEEELQAFNRARLTPVVTEEKVFLPSAEELRAAELEQALEVSPVGAAGLRDLLKEEDGREHRSSSEEWEKVDGDSEC